jgi:hypothetical protein
VVTPEFVAVVEPEAELPLGKLAWVCAMIACGYAPTLTGIAPHPLVIWRDGPQIERADGTEGWAATSSATPRRPSTALLDTRGPTVEFAGVGNHDELGKR